ncbi:gliding motility protein [Bacteroidia bacterium]|nr:gliding motility protein [Bacteroidia bacterium]
MLKIRYIVMCCAGVLLLTACSFSKNTATSRWYHSFNVRYNGYFNAKVAYDEALKNQQESYTENYAQMLLMFPVSSLPKEKTNTGGPFDKTIEKTQKAIKIHSIAEKPERDPNKRKDAKYREWMERKEYNPFLHNAWMLMAQAQFYNGDFLTAESSFAYIARLYQTQPEIAVDAQIWQARSYLEMGWFYEAENIFTQIKKDGLSKKLQDWYDTVYADYLIQQKNYAGAVPYLQTAIRAEKNKLQKNREKYLLGQIYSRLGEKAPAYQLFGEVAKASVPYPLSFSAKIRQTEVSAGGDTTKITAQLRKMLRNSKNKNYLDQIYYALGNVYLAIPDTNKAIDAYELGVKNSVQNGMDQALNQIRLGDLYFEQRKFIPAQPNYSGALSQLKKEDTDYPRVAKRSEVLDKLVVYVEAVELQDSLQRLAKMTEPERLAVVNKIIEDLKKKEAEEKKRQEQEKRLAQQDDFRAELNSRGPNSSMPTPRMVAPPQQKNNASAFYFYNTQMVAEGKNTFQQKWGRRKLEDDWRRRNKANPLSDPFTEDDLAAVSEENSDTTQMAPDAALADNPDSTAVGLSNDPHEPQFYLQQLPQTDEDFAASDTIIADGLFNMAVIYLADLNDELLALETFNELSRRFPNNGNQDQIAHYLRIMSDAEYRKSLTMTDTLQELLYQDTYQAYLQGDMSKIRENYLTANTEYPQSKLMPQFMFLDAMTYAQQHDPEGFKTALKGLITQYPNADVSELASEMMKRFQRGLVLSASGNSLLANGNLFNIQWGDSTVVAENMDTIPFSPEMQTPWELLILYSQGGIDDNLLLYTVASFNFGNFIRNDFDLDKSSVGTFGMLQIKPFDRYDAVMQYLELIYGEEGYANALDSSIVIVPISLENYTILMRGKSLDDYWKFFEQHFSEGNEDLLERWKAAKEVQGEGLKVQGEGLKVQENTAISTVE